MNRCVLPSPAASVFALAVIASALPLARVHAQGSARRHVASAEHLVQQLDLANTNYEHGQGNVVWTGTVESHTDCSGFIDHLLMHDDGYTADDFKRWFGSHRPTAARYHDAIVEGKGFTAVAKVSDLTRGDLIAIKYLTRSDNTGHIMLVVAMPRRINAGPPFVEGTTQWEVEVIDSSESGHGLTDTRHKRGDDGKDHDGLGRGVFRLYSNARSEVTGFAWSTMKVSKFVSPDEEHLVMGRLVEGFRP